VTVLFLANYPDLEAMYWFARIVRDGVCRRSGMHRVPTLMSLTTAKKCYSADLATNTEAASFFGVERVSSVDCARSGAVGVRGREQAIGSCPFRKSYPDVMVVQPGQDWNGDYDTGAQHRPRRTAFA
jgi:hypothetical protein